MAKTLLVVFNALFLVCGIALLIVGVIDFKHAHSVGKIIEELNGVNTVAIIVGATILVISFLGCCGALKENSCMLNAFLGLLLIILIAEISVGYLALNNRNKVEDTLKKTALNTLNQTKSTDSKLLKDAWDDVQLTWHCCGVNNYTDYEKFDLQIPESCCKKVTTPEAVCERGNPNLQKIGCFSEMKNFAERNSLGIGVAAIIIAFIEVAGIIFACCLRSAINERYQTV